MNTEAIQSVIESCPPPIMGVGIGLAVGAAGMWDIKRNLATNRSKDEVAEAFDVSAPASLRKRIITPALAVLALSGVGGGLVEMALRNDTPDAKTYPSLGIVVDHSFEVSEKQYGGDGSVKKIDSLAAKIASNPNLDTDVYLSHGEIYKPADKASEIKKDGKGSSPSGSQSMIKPTADALKNAFGQSGAKIAKPSSKNEVEPVNTAAVLVVTDGNTIGNPKVVTNMSKAYGGIRFYIADSGSKSRSSDLNTAVQLKKIARETNGEYWRISENNSSSIEKTITDTLKPRVVEVEESKQGWIIGALGAAVLITGGSLWWSMRDDTFNTKLR